MYLLIKFGHSSYENGDISSYITAYMNILQKAEPTAEVPEQIGSRIQAVAKRFALQVYKYKEIKLKNLMRWSYLK